MPRTTPALVKGIISIDDTVDLTPSIATADNLVTQVCLTSGYSSETLEFITRWLAAHFAAINNPSKVRERAEPTEWQIESKVDLGLSVTRWGQQAIVIDTAGNLAKLDARKRRIAIGIRHLGNTEALTN